MPEPLSLVLLHPFPLDAGFWNAVRPALSADRPVVACEFPGLGSAPMAEEPSVDGFADSVAATIAAECPQGRAVVCGLSLGGYVALALAARHPERVAALVLADTRAEDLLTPVPCSQALVDGLPDAELVVIPESGHLTALEHPTAFAAAVRAFLDRRLG